jgi:hypothetical protein
MALILILPVCSSARAQPTGSAGALLFDEIMSSKCTRPDSKLIRPGGLSEKYNHQAKDFNDCLRIYVENENNKITRIRAEAGGTFDRITDSATSQIRDIERAIANAITEVHIVNGEAMDTGLPPPAIALTSFPVAECKKPDAALLRPAKGKQVASLQATDRYEAQRLDYESCMRLYVAQAKNEIIRVKANAEAAFHQVAEDANPRITQINSDVTEALNEARKASGERDAAVNAFHSPLPADGLSPAAFQPLQNQQGQADTESVTVSGERLPRSADMPTGAGDPDAISCRAPQQLPGSRLMGPEICKRNRDWAKLYKDGQNLSPDGTQIVKGERERTFNVQACTTQFSVPNRSDVMVTNCGTPGGQ